MDFGDKKINFEEPDLPDGFAPLRDFRDDGVNRAGNYEYVIHDTEGNRISVGLTKKADTVLLVNQGISPVGVASVLTGQSSGIDVSLSDLSASQARELANVLLEAADFADKHSEGKKADCANPFTDEEISTIVVPALSPATSRAERLRLLLEVGKRVMGSEGNFTSAADEAARSQLGVGINEAIAFMEFLDMVDDADLDDNSRENDREDNSDVDMSILFG